MLIESGPNLERRVRSGLLFIMVAAFAGYFAFDGWRGYAKQNLDAYLVTIAEEHRPRSDQVRVYESINEEIVPRLAKVRVVIADDAEKALSAVVGGPPSIKTPVAWYYIGPSFAVKLSARDGSPTGETVAIAPKHTATDISGQKIWAYGLFVLAGGALLYVIKVNLAKARLDDAGLTLGGGPTIAWDSMKRLDTADFRKKGWVDLVHGEPEETTRINEYHYAKFNEIINAICARKGFENPLAEEPEASSESEITPADQPEA